MTAEGDVAAAETLAAFRIAFAHDLTARREASGHEPRALAYLTAINPELYELFESGQSRPSVRRVSRLAAVFGIDPLDWLEEVAETVRPRGLTDLPFTAEALTLYLGVTPEQLLRLAPAPLDDVEPAPEVYDLGSEPLGKFVLHTRFGDPLRTQAAQQLRKEYEADDQPGIGALAKRHNMSFGACRTLLLEAETPLRGQGRRPSKA